MKKKHQHILLLLFIIVSCAFVSIYVSSIETYMDIPLATRDRCPTRNMSYDIRGDIPIKRETMIFNNPAWGPLDPEMCQNRPLV